MQQDKIREVQEWERKELESRGLVAQASPEFLQQVRAVKALYEMPGMGVLKELVEENVNAKKDELARAETFRDVTRLQGEISGVTEFWYQIYDLAKFKEDEEDENEG